MLYSNTAVNGGGGEYGKSSHLSIFQFFEAPNDVVIKDNLKCNFFQGFIITPYQRH